ncbi:MAG: hypothetical protein KIT62_12710 [Cyclobacteriaceae bacterium]|nr:hypothetical protein [Cyclobacteriaceae bacterium]
MLKKRVYRGILMVAGLLAAAVIVLSHGFTAQESVAEKKPTEQSRETEPQTVISAPTVAVTQSSAVQVDEQVPQALLEVLSEPKAQSVVIPVAEQIFSNFLKTLFRVIISPNAP